MKRGENLTFGENRGGTKSSEKFGNFDFLDSLHLLKLGELWDHIFKKSTSGVTSFPCRSFYEVIGRILHCQSHVYILYESVVLYLSGVIDDSCSRGDTCRKQARKMGTPRADITPKAR